MQLKEIINRKYPLYIQVILIAGLAISYDFFVNANSGSPSVIYLAYHSGLYYLFGAYLGFLVFRGSRIGGDATRFVIYLTLPILVGRNGPEWGFVKYLYLLVVLSGYVGFFRILALILKRWLEYDLSREAASYLIAIPVFLLLMWFFINPALVPTS